MRAKGMADKLGIEDEVEFTPITVVAEEPDFGDMDEDLRDDYIFIRRKLRYATAACEAVLEAAIKDMATNPGARAVEGCSAIIKTITECTSQLLGLHEKRKKICNIADPEPEKEEDEEGGEKKSVSCKIDDIIDSFDRKKQ